MEDLTVYALPGNGRAFVREPVRQAVLDATEALVDRGAAQGQLRVPDLGRSFEIWAAMLSDGADRYDDVVGDGTPIRLRRQLLAYPLGRSDHAASVLLLLALERTLAWMPARTAALASVAERLRAHLEAGLGPDGVLIHPVYARTAPRHRGFLMASPFDASLTTAFNITTLPATVVPVGRDARGLPLAVQIVARRGNDHLCLAVAEALQDSFGRLPVAQPTWGRPLPLGLRLA